MMYKYIYHNIIYVLRMKLFTICSYSKTLFVFMWIRFIYHWNFRKCFSTINVTQTVSQRQPYGNIYSSFKIIITTKSILRLKLLLWYNKSNRGTSFYLKFYNIFQADKILINTKWCCKYDCHKEVSSKYPSNLHEFPNIFIDILKCLFCLF